MAKRKPNPHRLTVLEWRDALNAIKVPIGEQQALREEKMRVLERMGHVRLHRYTGEPDLGLSMSTITGAIYRGTIGESMLTALEDATAGEPHKVLVSEHTQCPTTNGTVSYHVARQAKPLRKR